MAAVLRAMGVESDQELLALVGSETALAPLLAPTLQEAKSMGVFIRQPALEYLGICHQFLCILFTQCQPVSILQRVNYVALLAWRHGASVGESKVLVRCAGSRIKAGKQQYSSRRSRSKVDEARDILANVVVSHIPVLQYDFHQKVCTPSSFLPSDQAFLNEPAWYFIQCHQL